MMINQSSARPGFTNITSCPGEGARGNQETPESAVKTYAGHCGHPEELCCDSGPPKKKWERSGESCYLDSWLGKASQRDNIHFM